MWESLVGKWSKKQTLPSISSLQNGRNGLQANMFILPMHQCNGHQNVMSFMNDDPQLIRWGRQWSNPTWQRRIWVPGILPFLWSFVLRPIPGAASWTLGMNWIEVNLKLKFLVKCWDAHRLCYCWGKAICCGQQKWSSIYWLYTLDFRQCSLWFVHPGNARNMTK